MKKHYFILVIMVAVAATLTAQTAQRYYWVGGGANNNWGTLANWSSTSGGTPAAGITNAPANVNTVVFDQNSFPGGDSLVVINGAMQCDSLIVQNCTKLPNFDFGNSSINVISINGSMFLQRGTLFTKCSHTVLNFVSSRAAETIYTDSVYMRYYYDPINPNMSYHGNISVQGDTATVWNLAGYTVFVNVSIRGGSFNLLGDSLHASNFSYTGNANLYLDSVRFVSGVNGWGTFTFNGNGDYYFRHASINGSLNLNGNGNYYCDSAFVNMYLSMTGNGTHYANYVTAGSISMIGNGTHYANNSKGALTLEGSGNNYTNNASTGTINLHGNGFFDVNNLTMNSGYIRIGQNGSGGTYNLNNANMKGGYVAIVGTGSISIVNSIFDCVYDWTKSGGSSINTTNSFIRVGTGFVGGGRAYNIVELTGSNFSISDGTFNKASVLKGGCTVNNITADTLLLCGERNIVVQNTVTVNNYFEVRSKNCGEHYRLYGSGTHLLAIGNTANYLIEKAVIHDLIVNRPVTAINSYDWGYNTNVSFTAPNNVGQDMYWTGGTGDWSDPAHWRLANGSPANCIPTLADNVFFDNTSSNGTPFTVTADAAYCNSMTWSNVPATSYFMPNAMYIDGSLTLSNTMEFGNGGIYGWSSPIYFISDKLGNTITTNGNSTLSNVYFQSMSGSGGWKIMDNFTLNYNVTNGIYFNSGHLDLSGYIISISLFSCPADNNLLGLGGRSPLRTIDFNNSTIRWGNWEYIGGQQIAPAHSANSLIYAGNVGTASFVSKGGDYYHNVNAGDISCINGTSYFNKITVQSGSLRAFVNNGNGTLYPDSLIFVGKGNLLNPNTIGEYLISDTLPIRKYLGTTILDPCVAKTRLTGNVRAVFQMDTVNPVLADRVQVQNAEISRINITNGPYDVTYCDTLGGSTGWNNTVSVGGYLGRCYWVGGASTGGLEQWNDPMHWASTSGGVPGTAGCEPTRYNTVVFDDNSGFTSSARRIGIGSGAVCDSLLCLGTGFTPQFVLGGITVHGSMVLRNTVGMTGITMASSRPNETIFTDGASLSGMNFDGTGGWTLLDSVKSSGNWSFARGNLNFNGQYVSIRTNFSSTYADRNNRFLDIRNAEIRLEGYRGSSDIPASWNYTGNLLADSSFIYTTRMQAEQPSQYIAQYHNVELYPFYSQTGYLYYGKYNMVNVLFPLDFRQIETDTIFLSTASNYTYTFRDTIRVNEAYYGMGTPCSQIYLQSYTETVPAIFDIKTAAANLPNDTLLIDNVYLHGIKAHTGVGNAKLKKGQQSPDINKIGSMWGYGIGTNNYNQDWAAMLPFNSGGSTYFGADRIIPCGGFPDTLSSDNFIPSFGAIFQWRKDSLNSPVIATTPTYIVTDSGRYFLTIDYGNDCKITDDILFTLLIDSDSISETICYGETYSGYNLVDLDTAGFYISRYTTPTGCDSLIYLTLSILPKVDTTIINASICKGDAYQLDGFYETDEGFYSRTTPDTNGCDSVIHLYLSHYPDIDTTFYDTICLGDSILFGKTYYSQTGIYTDSLLSENGCDSIVTLDLTVNLPSDTTLYDTVCQYNTYTQHGFNLSANDLQTAGSFVFRDTLFNAVGCDSVVTLQLTVNKIDTLIIQDVICLNNPYSNHGFTIPVENLQTAGTFAFSDTLSNTNGCDSIVILQLTVLDELPLDVNLGNDTLICWLDSLKLDAFHPNANRYQWQDGSTGMVKP